MCPVWLGLAAPKGAVNKVAVVVHDEADNEQEVGAEVGSLILNTTANNVLIVVVNLDDAIPLEDDPLTENVDEGIYDCRIWVDAAVAKVTIVDCLKVNANGQGTATVKVDLTDIVTDDATEISVKVALRPWFNNPTEYPTPSYVQGRCFRHANYCTSEITQFDKTVGEKGERTCVLPLFSCLVPPIASTR